MNEVKNLLKAQQDLLKAKESIPQNISKAAEKLSEKTGMDYYGALEIIDIATTPSKRAAKSKRVAKQATKKRGKGGYGGRVNPESLSEIKSRAASATGDKKDLYLAAHELFKNKGEWVSGKKLRDLGINTKIIGNKHRMTACLPIGYRIQSSSHGFKAFDLSEALTK